MELLFPITNTAYTEFQVWIFLFICFCVITPFLAAARREKKKGGILLSYSLMLIVLDDVGTMM